MDVGAWFATLTKRMKEIAKDLAFGCSTSEVAKKHGVTAGRISQLRRVLEESWAAFQREAVAAVNGLTLKHERWNFPCRCGAWSVVTRTCLRGF